MERRGLRDQRLKPPPRNRNRDAATRRQRAPEPPSASPAWAPPEPPPPAEGGDDEDLVEDADAETDSDDAAEAAAPPVPALDLSGADGADEAERPRSGRVDVDVVSGRHLNTEEEHQSALDFLARVAPGLKPSKASAPPPPPKPKFSKAEAALLERLKTPRPVVPERVLPPRPGTPPPPLEDLPVPAWPVARDRDLWWEKDRSAAARRTGDRTKESRRILVLCGAGEDCADGAARCDRLGLKGYHLDVLRGPRADAKGFSWWDDGAGPSADEARTALAGALRFAKRQGPYSAIIAHGQGADVAANCCGRGVADALKVDKPEWGAAVLCGATRRHEAAIDAAVRAKRPCKTGPPIFLDKAADVETPTLHVLGLRDGTHGGAGARLATAFKYSTPLYHGGGHDIPAGAAADASFKNTLTAFLACPFLTPHPSAVQREPHLKAAARYPFKD